MRHTILTGLAGLMILATSIVPEQLHAQTKVQMHLTQMLSPEEATGLRAFSLKVRSEEPYLTCSGDEAPLTLFVALFQGEQMVLSRTGGEFRCGGSIERLPADEVTSTAVSLSRAVRSDGQAAENFFPGDQFLAESAFSSAEYRRGSVVPGLSKELGIDFGRTSWYLVTAVASSGRLEVKSTPWVVLDRGLER